MKKGSGDDSFDSISSVMQLIDHKQSLKAVCLSSDKKYAASLSEDDVLKVWKTDVRY